MSLCHRVPDGSGGVFSRVLEQSKYGDVVKKLGPYLKATAFMLKFGCAAARTLGYPVPDLSALIPDDFEDDASLLVSAMHDKVMEGLSNKQALLEKDGTFIKAVEEGRVGSARLRPRELQGDQLDLAKGIFGDVESVCDL